MAPRKRKQGREGWPDNLYPNGKYYKYINPITKKVRSLNCSFEQACEAAQVANAYAIQKKNDLGDLIGKLLKPEQKKKERLTFADVMERYTPHRLQGRQNANTLSTYTRYCRRLSEAPFATRQITDITVEEIATWLDSLAPTQYVKLRAELAMVYQFATQRGWYDFRQGNPVDATEQKAEPKRVRKRMPLEAIYALASPRLKLTMYIMLHTTLRPIDIIWLRKDEFIPDDSLIRTKIRKSERDNDPTTAKYLEVELSEDETANIRKALKDLVLSPFVVHREKHPTNRAAWTEHWSQCTVDVLSTEFREIRDRLGWFKELDAKVRPPLYEIRALASHLYDLAGRSQEERQRLMAHTEGKTTQRYGEGHAPIFERVKAGLDLNQVRNLVHQS